MRRISSVVGVAALLACHSAGDAGEGSQCAINAPQIGIPPPNGPNVGAVAALMARPDGGLVLAFGDANGADPALAGYESYLFLRQWDGCNWAPVDGPVPGFAVPSAVALFQPGGIGGCRLIRYNDFDSFWELDVSLDGGIEFIDGAETNPSPTNGEAPATGCYVASGPADTFVGAFGHGPWLFAHEYVDGGWQLQTDFTPDGGTETPAASHRCGVAIDDSLATVVVGADPNLPTVRWAGDHWEALGSWDSDGGNAQCIAVASSHGRIASIYSLGDHLSVAELRDGGWVNTTEPLPSLPNAGTEKLVIAPDGTYWLQESQRPVGLSPATYFRSVGRAWERIGSFQGQGYFDLAVTSDGAFVAFDGSNGPFGNYPQPTQGQQPVISVEVQRIWAPDAGS